MRRISIYFAVSMLLVPFVISQSAAPNRPLVSLGAGTLKGKMKGDIAVFEGVPFAQPPMGLLRWREPQPVIHWPDIRDATQPSPPCMQSAQGVDTFIQPLAAAYGASYSPQHLSPSEDCLYLNIWTPKLQVGGHLPVMVWLHGGSNRVGSGSEAAYDGGALASHGVIVVTTNYRLGVLGFFVHPDLVAESPHHSAGNYGLLDQIAALRWVQQNIVQFGGDPGNVTLFGESAGSVDATTLMTSPLATNLFRRVIAESGPAFGLGPVQTVGQMERLGAAAGKAAGGTPGSELAFLRTLPAPRIAQIESQLIANQFKGYDPNASVEDGWVLPISPARAFAQGKLQPVDLLAGLNAREFSAFRVGAAAAAKSAPKPAPKVGMAEQIAQIAKLARPLYGDWTDLAVATFVGKILIAGTPAVDQVTNDIIGACPVGAEAALTTSAGRSAFVYRFDRSVPGKGEAELGAFHSLEIPYVFGTFQVRTFDWLPFTTTDYKLSQTIQTYWTSFAKSGDPNGRGLPQWSRWSTGQEPYMSFGQNGDALPQKDFSPIYCHLAPERLKQQLAEY